MAARGGSVVRCGLSELAAVPIQALLAMHRRPATGHWSVVRVPLPTRQARSSSGPDRRGDERERDETTSELEVGATTHASRFSLEETGETRVERMPTVHTLTQLGCRRRCTGC